MERASQTLLFASDRSLIIRCLLLAISVLILASCERKIEDDRNRVAISKNIKPTSSTEFMKILLEKRSGDRDYSTKFIKLDVKNGVSIWYVEGSSWCGSGGCTLFILSPPQNGSTKIVGEITLAIPPIGIRKTENLAYPDILIHTKKDGRNYINIFSFKDDSYRKRDEFLLRKENSIGDFELFIEDSTSLENLY